jgi:hypothetical protein
MHLCPLPLALSLCAGLSIQTPAAPDLDYTCTVRSDPAPSFGGELRFRAAGEGPTHVTLDEGWGGTRDIAAQLELVRSGYIGNTRVRGHG